MGLYHDAQLSLPRRENVSSNAIRPTWAPFSSTLSAEESLVFSLRLMNGRWEAAGGGFHPYPCVGKVRDAAPH